MKLIKKIAAIMFAFMMVFSLSTNAKAESGSQEGGQKGTITISNAIKDQDYKIYKILDLESFNSTKGSEAYSYKLTNDEWANFFKTGGPGNEYVNIDDQEYVTWKDDTNKEAQAAELSKKALAYAVKNNIAETKKATAETTTLEFKTLDLGYYLVESNVGALCGLNTTNPTVEIAEKNSQPTLEKNIYELNTNNPVKLTTANIGESIHYHVQITVGKGVNDYVFHDEIASGLKYLENDTIPFNVQITTNHEGIVKPNTDEYTLSLDTNKTSFTLKFEDSFIQKKLSAGDKIYLDYFATVTADAQMDTALRNTAYLNYGNNQKTKDDYADVYTYTIPVLKYTTLKDGTEKKLSGAKFKLYRGSKNVNNIAKFDSNNNTYTYNSKGTVEELESGADGYVNIQGLAAGTYILEETKAPDGYNKLKDPITITVNQKSNGTKEIIANNVDATGTVKVLNNKGDLLPSTGGMGTTMIYLIGGALVLGSGIVLANKKRAKAK